MSDNNSNNSSNIGLYIFLFVIIAATVAVLIYISTWTVAPFYPKNPFNVGDIVNISPAVLSDVNIPNQFFSMIPTGTSSCYNYTGANALFGWNMSANDCVVTFTGTDATSKNNQWVLLELDSSGNNSTHQNLQNGQGNRFYLKNNNFTDNSNRAGRLRYEPFQTSVALAAMCPSTTFVVAGGTCTEHLCSYDAELILYFLPTLFPDLYYILFPSNNTSGHPLFPMPPNTLQNNGMMSIRPFSAPNDSNYEANDPNCDDLNANFSPYCVNSTSGPGSCPDSEGPLNANGMLLNTLPGIPAMPPYNNFPNVYLFRVTKAPVV
jgi:hypothetical protein